MEEKIYPIYYRGKYWNESEVHDVFKCFYHTKLALDSEKSVYVGDGMRIAPDGEWFGE